MQEHKRTKMGMLPGDISKSTRSNFSKKGARMKERTQRVVVRSAEVMRLYGNVKLVDVGAHIRAARIVQGLTQQELADRIGKTQQFVARLEVEGASHTARHLDSVLTVLGIEVAVWVPVS